LEKKTEENAVAIFIPMKCDLFPHFIGDWIVVGSIMVETFIDL
jgi:hypothetical protein